MKTRKARRPAVIAVLVFATVFAATGAAACPVCYGEADAPILAAAETSVLLMLGVTYVLLGLGLALFFVLRHRAKRLIAAGSSRCSENAVHG